MLNTLFSIPNYFIILNNTYQGHDNPSTPIIRTERQTAKQTDLQIARQNEYINNTFKLYLKVSQTPKHLSLSFI